MDGIRESVLAYVLMKHVISCHCLLARAIAATITPAFIDHNRSRAFPVQLYQFGVGIIWSGCRDAQLGCNWICSIQHGVELQADGVISCSTIFLLFARQKLPVNTQVCNRTLVILCNSIYFHIRIGTITKLGVTVIAVFVLWYVIHLVHNYFGDYFK